MADAIKFKRVAFCLISLIVVTLVMLGCSGESTMALENGATYTGEVKWGKPNGQGTWSHPDGHIYVGEFKDGERHGLGTMTLPDGTVLSGKFENDEYIGIADELEQGNETNLSQDNFSLRIDTLPYRGAVLFIDYDGEVDISEYELRVDIMLNDVVVQKNIPSEYVDGNLISEIIDLMYLPGDELEFILKVQEDESLIFECYHSEKLKRYPWKDWMMEDGEWFSITDYSPNFKYNFPSCPNALGAHSSWDIMTSSGKAVPVYSGTMGIVHEISLYFENIEIYNPYVGAIVQYSHTEPVESLYVGKIVRPGEHISNVIPNQKHIHYSVIRPYEYAFRSSENFEKYYNYLPLFEITKELGVSIVVYTDSYNDPFYFHEPTSLGYWNEETLPPGLKEKMLMMFQKHNPDVVLPATRPLDSD